MRPVALDYCRPVPRRSWIAFLFFALGLGGSVYSVRCYYDLAADLDAQRIATTAQVALSPPSAAEAKALQAEIEHAQSILARLTLPWESIFAAIEKNQVPGIALLSIRQQSDNMRITLNGESKDYDALMTYVQRLQRNTRFTDVFLLSHEVQVQDPQKPLRFQISARWKLMS